MFSLLLARLPIPADILEVQHRAMNRMDHVEFNPEMLLITVHLPNPRQVTASLRRANWKQLRIIAVLCRQSPELSNELRMGVVTT